MRWLSMGAIIGATIGVIGGGIFGALGVVGEEHLRAIDGAILAGIAGGFYGVIGGGTVGGIVGVIGGVIAGDFFVGDFPRGARLTGVTGENHLMFRLSRRQLYRSTVGDHPSP